MSTTQEGKTSAQERGPWFMFLFGDPTAKVIVNRAQLEHEKELADQNGGLRVEFISCEAAYLALDMIRYIQRRERFETDARWVTNATPEDQAEEQIRLDNMRFDILAKAQEAGL